MQPISATERIDVLDVLRGFALFGVLWANILWFFSGYGDLAPGQRAELATATFDPIALKLETFFVVGKFITIFSFLFGVGFAIQQERAVTSGKSVRALFARRMFWLFIIGLAHALFVWSGDILHLYAVLGIVLMGFAPGKGRWIILLGVFAAVLLPSLIGAFISIVAPLTDGAVDPSIRFDAVWQAASDLRAIAVHGSYGDLVRANTADLYAWLTTDDALTTGISSFGKFLLGYWVGKEGLLAIATAAKPPGSRQALVLHLLKRCLIVGVALGVLCQGAVSLLPGEPWYMSFARSLLWDVGVLALAAAYVCGVTLLFRDNSWRKRLFYFAPVGRMALTNYLGQSIICIFLFYGLGWYGRVGPTGSIGVALGVFMAQTAMSHWWLSRFRFGPAEWAWRSLTYGTRQPLALSRSD